MTMSRTDEIYKRALAKTKIPLLVLDNNWHKLFTQTDETPEIRKLEKKLNELLKEQGKSNTEQKKLKACKRKLMDEIIQLADRYGGRMDEAIEREMDRHRRLVEECNGRLEQLQENTGDNEEEIEETNYQLMLKTMELCYKRLEENRKEIEYYEDWIKKAREELKEISSANRSGRKVPLNSIPICTIFSAGMSSIFLICITTRKITAARKKRTAI